MQKPLLLTDKNFKKEVLESDIPVLVEFWASWCPPCKVMEPIIEELANEYEDRIKVGKLNVDQNQRITADSDIKGIPTFTLYREGKVTSRRIGAQSKDQLDRFLDDIYTDGQNVKL